MFALRDYQQEAVDAVWRYWGKGGGNPLVEIPTGGGKSAVIGESARRLVQAGARVVIATHRKELISQDASACRMVWPEAPVGIYSAGLNLRQVREITVCGVQSVWRRPKVLGPADVLIIDEAHLVPPNTETSYGKLIKALHDVNPDLRLLGFTATPFRLNQGLLTTGEGHLFDAVVYRAEMRTLIEKGYLSPIITGVASVQVATDGAKTSGGEWVLSDLELAADVDSVTDGVCDDVVKALGAGRTSALLFGCGVQHAAHLRNGMRWRGVSCELVTGETDPGERKRVLEAFKRRELAAIASCDVLTTGFDAPCVDVIALVRPTKSASLYVQMVGRGSRIAGGKDNCLLLDYGGNIARHGPVDDVRVRVPKDGGASEGAPFKVCPECAAQCATAVRQCPHCDYEFPAPQKKANQKASTLPAMSTAGAPITKDEKRAARVTHEVGEVRFFKHQKKSDPDAPPSLRIEYYGKEDPERFTPKRIATEWVCLEHEGFARRKAEDWWRSQVGTPCPATVDEAMERLRAGEIPRVLSVTTEPDGEFTRVAHVLQERPREPGADDDGPQIGGARYVDGLIVDDDLPF